MISATKNYMVMGAKAEIHGDKIVGGIIYDLSEDCEQAEKQAKYIKRRLPGTWEACINGELYKVKIKIEDDGITIVLTPKSTGITKVHQCEKSYPEKIHSAS